MDDLLVFPHFSHASLQFSGCIPHCFLVTSDPSFPHLSHVSEGSWILEYSGYGHFPGLLFDHSLLEFIHGARPMTSVALECCGFVVCTSHRLHPAFVYCCTHVVHCSRPLGGRKQILQSEDVSFKSCVPLCTSSLYGCATFTLVFLLTQKAISVRHLSQRYTLGLAKCNSCYICS